MLSSFFFCLFISYLFPLYSLLISFFFPLLLCRIFGWICRYSEPEPTLLKGLRQETETMFPKAGRMVSSPIQGRYDCAWNDATLFLKRKSVFICVIWPFFFHTQTVCTTVCDSFRVEKYDSNICLRKICCCSCLHLRKYMGSFLDVRILSMLTRLTGAKDVLELGTFTGYSALCFAEAIPASGSVVTCDIDPEATSLASSYFGRSSVGHKVRYNMCSLVWIERLYDEISAGWIRLLLLVWKLSFILFFHFNFACAPIISMRSFFDFNWFGVVFNLLAFTSTCILDWCPDGQSIIGSFIAAERREAIWYVSGLLLS